MDAYELETSFALVVVATLVWILLMIFAVVQRVFKETLVLAVIGGSLALATPVAFATVSLMGGWNQSEFIFYLAFWWLFLGVVMTLVPVYRWFRSNVW